MAKIVIKDNEKEKGARRDSDFRSCVGCWRRVY